MCWDGVTNRNKIINPTHTSFQNAKILLEVNYWVFFLAMTKPSNTPDFFHSFVFYIPQTAHNLDSYGI